jgi:ubiquinone/menaquinone biosynthesis C-methylase UbiE
MSRLDQHGRFWDRVVVEAQPLKEAVSLIESCIPQSKLQGCSALDAGCGTGDYSAALEQLGARKVTGFDVSIQSIKSAQQQSTGEFLQASLSELPFNSNTFDVLWSWGVLHYVPDWRKALKEIERVLRPDGIAIIHTIRAGFWASLERNTAKVFSAAPNWVEPVIIGTGERILPIVSRVLSGKPKVQTSKTMRQKLHERLFVPGDTHAFTLAQLQSAFMNDVTFEEIRPPVSDFFKRDMSITISIRKHR